MPLSRAEQGYVPQSTVYVQPKRRRGCLLPILALLLVGGIAGGAVYLYFNPLHYNVTVNGVTAKVDRNATIADVIDAGYAEPVPGNLLAIDGSVALEGGGDAFAATVDGTATNDPTYVLKKDAVVQIDDGADVTEEYVESEEVVPHGTVETDTSAGADWAGSLHVYQKGEDGTKVTRTGAVSGITLTEQTKDPVDSGYRIYNANVGEDKVVALTFDDGPWPETTAQILDVLEANGAKATFFTIGEQISYNTDLVQREHDEGHAVASHNWSHGDVSKMSGSAIRGMKAKVDKALYPVIGITARYDRVPYGLYPDMIDAKAGWPLIQWSVDPEDWRLRDAGKVTDFVLENVQPGDIILLHDSLEPSVDAALRIVDALQQQGYTFLTVRELLEKAGVTPEAGVRYRSVRNALEEAGE